MEPLKGEKLVSKSRWPRRSLLYHFLWANDDNYVQVEILGKRKRELGLVEQAKKNDVTLKRVTANILDVELSKGHSEMGPLSVIQRSSTFFAVWKFFKFLRVECPKTVFHSLFFLKENIVVNRGVFRTQLNIYDGAFLRK